MKRSLRSWLWRVDITQEVDEEIAFHIEMRTRELVDKGARPEDRARDGARANRRCRSAQADLRRPWQKAGSRDATDTVARRIRDDVRFAVRQLKASPGFTFVAVITLALGIGANGAIFALADATLLRPLPFPEPDRLAIAWERSDALQRGPVSPLNMLDWNDQTRTFEKMAGFVPGVGSMVMAGQNGATESVPRQWVTSGVFDVLGVKPIAGRTFLSSDDREQISAVVLSEGFWRTVLAPIPQSSGDRFGSMGCSIQSWASFPRRRR